MPHGAGRAASGSGRRQSRTNEKAAMTQPSHTDDSSPATGMTYALGQYTPAVEAALAEMSDQRVMARIWDHDHTVWGPTPGEITNRLGWLDSPQEMVGKAGELEALAAEVRAAGYTQVLLLGMGGSSLAPEVLSKVFGGGSLQVLDSTDPGAVLAHANRLDPARTLFIVATKSGGTVETLSFFRFFYSWSAAALGAAAAGEHFVAITDLGSALEEMAGRYQFRATFCNDPNIGGRNSVLSYFGLVPAALIGVDLPRLLERALGMRSRCGADVPPAENPAAQLGTIMGELARAGRDKLTLVPSPTIASFAYWVEQLVAESTGKDGVGILPIEGEKLGPPAVYSEDRLFVQLELEGEDAQGTALRALQEAGHPVVRLRLRDRHDLGEQFFLWELATAVASHRLGVNSFNQPNVEAAKRLARQMAAEYRETGNLPSVESAPLTAEALRAFLASARPGDYIALQAYVQPTSETDAALLALRTALRDRYKLATTVGYGPRFLHSTGQLHKGDAGKGLFIQFTADDGQDAAIPDEAGAADSSMTFGVVKAAQALGDRQALLEAGRRVIRFHLGSEVVAGLERLGEGL